MSTIFRWIGKGTRALLIFIAVTAMLGVSHWLIERRSIGDLLAAAILGLGWLGIVYAMFKGDRPYDRGQW